MSERTDWPQIDILVVTYNRVRDIQLTIDALLRFVDYPADRLRFLIADDATPAAPDGTGYAEALSQTETFKKIRYQFVPAPQNVGWGANVNRAIAYGAATGTGQYIFQMEDDYVLQRPLNLKAAVALMETVGHIGLLRFRGTGGEHFVFHEFEAQIGNWLPDYREGVGLPGRMTYFLFDGGSPALYIYSNSMHLKRYSFHWQQHYGLYREGAKLGETEEAFAHTVKDGMRDNQFAPTVAILPEWIAMHWDHIGQSYQHTELDKDYR